MNNIEIAILDFPEWLYISSSLDARVVSKIFLDEKSTVPVIRHQKVVTSTLIYPNLSGRQPSHLRETTRAWDAS